MAAESCLRFVPGRRSGLGAAALGAVMLTALAFLHGCDDKASAGVESVKLGDKWFHLEVADTNEKRFHGLSDRTEIAADGGMIFLFPRPQPLQFVMRDCPIPIDVLFLDGAGRIVAMHQMAVEKPRQPDEPASDDPSKDKYEQRLVRYPSRFAAQFVIELRGATIPTLHLKEGDKVPLDTDRLKAMAK